jgi:F-type H+-transporting ATPase subunit gamma
MANVLDIRRRIRSVKSTRQITGAMKMVSAAKLRRAQERALAARPYGQMLNAVLKSLIGRVEPFDPHTGEARHPLLLQREPKRVMVVVVTADRGLAGAFNSNIIKQAVRFLASMPEMEVDLELIGRKGRDFFHRRYPLEASSQPRSNRIRITGEHLGVLDKGGFSAIRNIAEDAVRRYVEGEVDAVYLLFNEFKSVIAQRLVAETVLPLAAIGEHEIAQAEERTTEERKRSAEAALHTGVGLRPGETGAIDEEAAGFGTRQVEYLYEQPAHELLAALLPRYVSVQFFRAVQESVAAEHAARMTAMDSATTNANQMIDHLTLRMNRVRQAAITTEIIEIVSGAAAL